MKKAQQQRGEKLRDFIDSQKKRSERGTHKE
jgi:hypothetical protein